MLKLYSSDNSVCTQKVLMTLNEKAMSNEIKKINLYNNQQTKTPNICFVITQVAVTIDKEVIEAADKYGMTMAFSGIRLFHH